MNEVNNTVLEDTHQPPVTAASAGTMLRQARETAGLQIAALALALKVPVKKLEALEADRFDLLPDAVFARALASSICRNLKIDPAPVLHSLPASMVPRLKVDATGINTPFRAAGDTRQWPVREQLARPVVWVALLLIAAIVIVLYVPLPLAQLTQLDEEVAKPQGATVAEASPVQASVVALAETAITQEVPANALVSAPVTPVVEPVTVVTTVDATVRPAQTTAIAPTAVVPASAAAPVAVGGGLLQLKARGPSWVEVLDAGGVLQLRKLLTAGEGVTVSGALPLSVVIGSADTIDVQVRGKPLDVTRFARDNVARFEVK